MLRPYSDVVKHFFQARSGCDESLYPPAFPSMSPFYHSPLDEISINYTTEYPDAVARRLPHITKIIVDPFFNIARSRLCPDCGLPRCND